MGPAWLALAGMLSDLSIPVHMIHAHALVDVYVAGRVLRETINPSAHLQHSTAGNGPENTTTAGLEIPQSPARDVLAKGIEMHRFVASISSGRCDGQRHKNTSLCSVQARKCDTSPTKNIPTKGLETRQFSSLSRGVLATGLKMRLITGLTTFEILSLVGNQPNY